VEPLGYCQNERRQGESRTEDHSHSICRCVRYTTMTLLVK